MKLKRETSRAKQDFRDYYSLGAERSLRKLYQGYTEDLLISPTKSLATLKMWSRAFNWQARIEEEDRKAQEAWERAQIRKVVEMKEKQAEEGSELQLLGRAVIRDYLGIVKDIMKQRQETGERIPYPPEIIRTISVNTSRFLIIEGAKLEATARGEPKEITEVQIKGNGKQRITSDELRRACRRILDRGSQE